MSRRPLVLVLCALASWPRSSAVGDGPSASLVPGDRFRIAATYSESSSLSEWISQTHLDFGGASAGILADWTVVSVGRGVARLEAECLHAVFAVSVPTKVRDPDSIASTAEWSHERPWRGRLEVALGSKGAVLVTDPKTIIGEVERAERKPPFRRAPGWPGTATVPGEVLAARLRRTVERTVVEIFRDQLPADPGSSAGDQAGSGTSGRGAGPPVSIPVLNADGRSEGTWELVFEPPFAIEAGRLECSPCAVAFVAPGGSRSVDPARLSRRTWSRRGSTWTEWSARVGYPFGGTLPWNRQVGGSSRYVRAEFLCRRLPDDSSTVPAETALDAPALVEGQVYLLDLEATGDVRSLLAGKTAGSWASLRGWAAARVASKDGSLRLEATFLDGSFAATADAGPGLDRLFTARPDRAQRDLAGVRFSFDPAHRGLDLSIEDGSAGAAGSGRRESAGSLDRRALSAWIRAAVVPAFLPGGTGNPPVAEVSVPDPGGGPPGALVVEIDDRAAPTVESVRVVGGVAENSTFALRTRWPSSLSAGGAYRRVPASLVVSRDSVLPFAAAAVWNLEEKVPASAGDGFRSEQQGARVSCRFRARQLLGPRARRPSSPEPSDAAGPGSRGPGPGTPMDALPPPSFAAAARGAVASRIAGFFSALPGGPDAIPAALDAYGEIERKEPGSWLACAVHAECVLRLAPSVGEASVDAIESRYLRADGLAVRVLAMRLVAHSGVAAARRVAAIGPLLADPDPTVARFAGRFLGGLRDPASVDALIGGLSTLEGRGADGGRDELARSFAQDLYRLLGDGSGATSSSAFAEMWSRLERKVPEDPLRPLGASHATRVRASRAFGDVRSPPIVFVLDASSSMELEVVSPDLPVPPAGEDEPTSRAVTKVEWAKREVVASVSSLADWERIGCIAFHATARTWVPDLRPATEATRRSLHKFLRGAASRRGTNIHEGLEKAFRLGDVSSVCLLSDGQPTVGEPAESIERDVFRWNYLRGVAIVVATFSADAAAAEGLCRALPRRNFGWLRVLDLGPEGRSAPGSRAALDPLRAALDEE